MERRLWGIFVLLFGVVVLSSALPVRPLVLVFPFWAVAVLIAAIATLVVALVATQLGWPEEVRSA